MAQYTTNYNLHKIELTDAPPDITVLNDNWDTVDAKLKELSESSVGETIKSYAVYPFSFTGSEFPYTCSIAHELGGEPTSTPVVTFDPTASDYLSEIEAMEDAYNNIYRVTFDDTNMTLYAKERPDYSFVIRVRVVG